MRIGVKMESMTEEEKAKRYAEAILYLLPFGWLPANKDFRFKKNGKTYDLSAADLTKHEKIEREGLFLCE